MNNLKKIICMMALLMLLTGCGGGRANEQPSESISEHASATQEIREKDVTDQDVSSQKETVYLEVDDVGGVVEEDFGKYETKSQAGQEEMTGAKDSEANANDSDTNAKGSIAATNQIPEDNGNDSDTSEGKPETTNVPSADEVTQNTNNAGDDSTDGTSKEAANASAAMETTKEEAKEPVEEEQMPVCTLLIECTAVLSHMDQLKEGKEAIIPANGIIFETKTVNIQEGDTVFDILQRELQNSRIPFEYTSTPAYSGNYIEGINNLYEFDCGELSGWMYSVNGVYPNYGCSQYPVQNKDAIVFRYTCDLGKDTGN